MARGNSSMQMVVSPVVEVAQILRNNNCLLCNCIHGTPISDVTEDESGVGISAGSNTRRGGFLNLERITRQIWIGVVWTDGCLGGPEFDDCKEILFEVFGRENIERCQKLATELRRQFRHRRKIVLRLTSEKARSEMLARDDLAM